MSKLTGFISDESYFWHQTGNGALNIRAGGWVQEDTHAENPETKRRVKNLLERSRYINELKVMAPRSAAREDIEMNHHPEYIDMVKKLSGENGGDAGVHAIVGPDSYEIALLSAGGVLTAVDAVMEKEVRNAYALVRPPGHHAEPNEGMGFCLFNNAAIAAKYARKKYGLKRILILDWDVHHGNGTESAFRFDPEVLFISIHQENIFPKNRGHITYTGEGAGEGFNVNIELPAGTGNEGYLYAIEKVVEPIVDQFKPELILVSAGQDPSRFDPLGRMLVTAEGFYQMALKVKQLAERHCGGRLAACHEGGYSTAYVPFCTLRIIEALNGKRCQVEDPFDLGYHEGPLYPNQKEAVHKVIAIQSSYWDF
ncbi:acetoin utilization deacetylase AcuC-like enzyme [Scopulibacillus daqui]|uniref:Acetoin utilization deacetylase AcuC-like enzyme n=1 Tax=Scopulibacillus daqui TaxID=1469162 RepID=A0ABS2Q1T7_9BACL|nr:class II histone deacetylase [Scopulibacillus daqui]MBM7646259.1 acetoin utilization deacetylase AcuC-like enzyme [Scopulibacillus daqui]